MNRIKFIIEANDVIIEKMSDIHLKISNYIDICQALIRKQDSTAALFLKIIYIYTVAFLAL